MTEIKILLVGAGQLGARYLQGLAKFPGALRIYICDPVDHSLLQARKKWNLVGGDINSKHQTYFSNNLDFSENKFDVAIISTTANVRLEVITSISKRYLVDYWILEKVLAQSEYEVNHIVKILERSKVWVNTIRRASPLYKGIKNAINPHQVVDLNFEAAAWGLACNSIHFLDVASWLGNGRLVSVNTDGLNNEWFESKRKGFYEVTGQLDAVYSNGARLSLISNPSCSDSKLSLKNGSILWDINEQFGIAKATNGVEVIDKIPLQSEVTVILISELIDTGNCDLASLSESAEMHSLLINSLSKHYSRVANLVSARLPIT